MWDVLIDSSSEKTGNTLFFGCRSSTRDYLYESDWAELVGQGALQLHTAFSRDQVKTFSSC